MLLTMIVAALAVDGLFSAAGLIPTTRPSREDIFGSVELDYKLVLNILGLVDLRGALLAEQAEQRRRLHLPRTRVDAAPRGIGSA